MRFLLLIFLILGNGFSLLAQQAGFQRAPIEGIRQNSPGVHALVNARIVIRPGKVLEKATLVIRDGIIVAVGTTVTPPADARIWDYTGKTIYPGFIEPFWQGAQSPQNQFAAHNNNGTQDLNKKGNPVAAPTDWNVRVHPERLIATQMPVTDKSIATLRKLGFTAALVVPASGVFQGQSALIHLGDGSPNQRFLQRAVAQHLAFQRGNFRDRSYPNSLMGAIALIRQTFYDALWYQNAWQIYRKYPQGQQPPELNLALQALEKAVAGKQAVVFAVEDDLDLLRALKIYREFKLQGWVRGSGYEYRQLENLTPEVPVVVPVNYPKVLPIASPEDALDVSLMALHHWEAAPDNARWLSEQGIPVALTTWGLKQTSQFWHNVRISVHRGLSETIALAALTTVPAKLIGMDQQLGTIQAGKLAYFTITDGNIFADTTQIIDVWIQGKRYAVTPQPPITPTGEWAFVVGENTPILKGQLRISGQYPKYQVQVVLNGKPYRVGVKNFQDRLFSFTFRRDTAFTGGWFRFTGTIYPQKLAGWCELPDGQRVKWQATFLKKIPRKSKIKPTPYWQPARRPLPIGGAFAFQTPIASPASILIKNATIWTAAEAGILEKTDMLIINGTIKKIGKNLVAPQDALVIDATGKHVTPGLIDAHSHTAISKGVNESTQAVTAEVRIRDVINNYDINIYRELAGGLTMANLLHGSANPIGGQNAVIKLRWGSQHPDALIYQPAPPGIKFALGENVKQSNWGDRFTTRYPQTRMGVEQIMRDRFKAALDYQKAWQRYRALPKKMRRKTIPPRKDLEMETLLEILQGKRWIHIHSYRQDEILAFVRVAQEFGLPVAAFQHVLEGYKVAEAIKAIRAGASTFSDWWAYKFEVYDAIPYNGALMHRVGVVVSYNSDSAELARRMNLEAAKAIKYGGLTREEAIQLVTLNPAKQLKIDHRVGTLEVGKDADFVIWSDDPLSTYAVCEQTWIEGKKYFDRNVDADWRQKVSAERQRLVQKYLTVTAASKTPKGKNHHQRSSQLMMGVE